MDLLGFALAVLIGVTLGLLGAGGSILTVPVFVYVLGYAAKPAIAMSLPVVGTTSLVGAIGHWRSGNVQLRPALLFGAVAMIGSYAGARLAALVSAGIQLTFLGVLMLGAALAMLRNDAPVAEEATTEAVSPSRSSRALVPIGLAIGLLTGIVGIGGGFLVVPALVLLARVPMRQAVGTSLVVIAMNSIAGALGYAGQFDLPWLFLIAFTAVAVGGILAGTRLARLIPQRTLRRGFAILLVGLATMILYLNRATLLPQFADAGGASSANHAAPTTTSESSHVAQTLL